MENSSASEVDIGVQDSEGEMTHAQVKLEPTANIEGVTVIQARGDQVADVGCALILFDTLCNWLCHFWEDNGRWE